MTIAVDLGRKATKQTNKRNNGVLSVHWVEGSVLCLKLMTSLVTSRASHSLSRCSAPTF